MFPEKLSIRLIELVSDEIDASKNGAAIEIGVGTDNFYSLVYKKMGFHTIAVDPIAYPPFVALAKQNGIVYDESCIYQKDGQTVIYTSQTSDLSSLYNHWWGVNAGKSKIIKSQTLKTFLANYNIAKISFLKVDTEGSEYEILQQFQGQPETLLPRVLEFEYGGGALKKDAQGGWAPAFFQKTILILQLLKEFGYQEAIIFDSVELEPIIFSLHNHTNFEELFKPDFEYGNLIAFRESISQIDTLKIQLQAYHNTLLRDYIDTLKQENLNLYLQLIKKDYPKRFMNKLKRMIGNK